MGDLGQSATLAIGASEMTGDICKRLAEPFDPAIVSWRVGPTNQDKSKGMALAYIDARDVMRRLDEVCGPENWQNDYPWSDGKRVVCRIGIRIGEEWIWKTDGAGDTDTEGEKGALSDAFKRSAVHWGIGRYLYDTKSPWVAIQQKGKSYVIAESEFSRLAAMLPRPGKPVDARSPAPPHRPTQPASPPQAPTSGQQSRPFAEPAATGRDATSTAASHTRSPTGSVPPPNPEEPPEVAEARRVARSAFWSRDDYGIDPAVIQGGMARWDAEFIAQADAAPNIDAFLKLKQDNKEAGYAAAWEDSVQPAVIRHFRQRCAEIENRLSGKMAAA